MRTFRSVARTVLFGVAVSAALSVALAGDAAGRGAGGAFDPSDWMFRAPIEPADPAPAGGIVELEVTAEVFDRARPDLSDVRVLAGHRILPWVRQCRRGTQRKVRVDTELYNPTYRPGEWNRVVVDFGDRLMKDGIRVDTPGSDFKRRITVEASQDALSWEVLTEDSFVFDVSTGPGGRYRRDQVTLPGNDFRYLRVTVHHDPDDPREVPITGVSAWRREGEPAPMEAAPVKESTVEQDDENNITLIELDLGYRHLPLRRLRLDFQDENFYRYATLWGRNDRVREAVRRLEDGGERVVVREQPWKRITAGHIHRYSAGPGRSASLSLDAGPYRYLQVRIHNGDDLPLTFLGAEADRYTTGLAFPPRRPGPYWLYFGNPDADMPDYDLGRYVRRLRSEGVTPAGLGDILPVWREAPAASHFSEHYRWVLWIALLGAVGLVGWMAWRQAAGVG